MTLETYCATWIPSLATAYTLQVTFDDQLKGPSQVVTVAETPHGCTEGPGEVVKEECRLLKFATRNSRGLRIRSNPTLQSLQVSRLLDREALQSTVNVATCPTNHRCLSARLALLRRRHRVLRPS